MHEMENILNVASNEVLCVYIYIYVCTYEGLNSHYLVLSIQARWLN